MPTLIDSELTGEPLLPTGDRGVQTTSMRKLRQLTQAIRRAGVMDETDMRVTSPGAGQVSIAAGYAWVEGTELTGGEGQHKYGVPLESTKTLTGIPTPSGATRRDRVIVRVYDGGDGDGTGLVKGEVQYIRNASETDTAENDAALLAAGISNFMGLAEVSITTGGVMTIVDKRIWALGAPLVTALPSNPVDGQEVIFQSAAMLTAGVAWRFRYDASYAGANKWEFIGGGPLESEVATLETTASTSYTDLATAGPSITVPLAGDYRCRFGCRLRSSTTPAAGRQLNVGLRVGSTEAVDADSAEMLAPAAATPATAQTRSVSVAATASDLVKMRYKSGNADATLEAKNRWLEITPERVI